MDAFNAVVRALEEGYTIALTADVPKVSRVAGLGIDKIAQMSSRPIYPVAVATRRRIELDNWDRTAINLPFGRGALGCRRAGLRAAATPTAPRSSRAPRRRRGARRPDQPRLRNHRRHSRRVPPVADRPPLTLRAYRLLTAMAAPVANMVLPHRLKRGKELAARLPERRGESSVARPEGPLVWLHGASVGEMLSILPLIDLIRARDITVLVTSGTVTAAELAEHRLPPGVIHQFAPGRRAAIRRALPRSLAARPRPVLESDLWPNLIMTSAERGIPLILINGRVSERSFQRWRRLPRTIGGLLSRFDLCLAQSAEDAARYAELGAPRYRHDRQPQARRAGAAGRPGQARSSCRLPSESAR